MIASRMASPKVRQAETLDEVGLSQPTISQHLSEIKKIGLLKGTFKGKNLCYCINQERWNELQELFNSFFLKINTNCCKK